MQPVWMKIILTEFMKWLVLWCFWYSKWTMKTWLHTPHVGLTLLTAKTLLQIDDFLWTSFQSCSFKLRETLNSIKNQRMFFRVCKIPFLSWPFNWDFSLRGLMPYQENKTFSKMACFNFKSFVMINWKQ